jgi:hypothetical protein
MHARVGRLILISAPLALLLSVGCSSSPTGPGGGGECAIQAEGEKEPGFPFSLKTYEEQVLPVLKEQCASCHDPGAVNEANWAIKAQAAEKGNCEYADTFNALKDVADTTTPENSAFVATRAVTPHDTLPAEAFDTLLAYVQEANAACVEGGGCQDAGGILFFNKETFESTIQPALLATCGTAGCHAEPGQGGFNLKPEAVAGSPESQANFDAVTSNNVTPLGVEPEQSLIYIQATELHGQGASRQLEAADADALLAWITDAKAAFDESGGQAGGVNCADDALLNRLAWENEIFPLLRGEVDYNDPNNDQILTGCARTGGAEGACHDTPRPGSFDLVGTPEEALQKFACFIDLNTPSRSQVLLCPSKDAACRVGEHPGGELFVDANDVNYQKMLSFLFASVADKSPIDFAQFAVNINPIFDDPNACNEEGQLRACTDRGCHFVQVAGAIPDNNSDFGLLEEVGQDPEELKTNYASASNFISFGVPEASSLFLYPTNEIANDDNQFASGIEHGGGQCFAVDSAQADDVLAWAEALRPDAEGFQTAWLVQGNFPTIDPDDDPLADEENVRPEIFTIANGDQNNGEWDFFQSDVQDVDVGAAVGGQVGNGRIVYAASYLMNTTQDTLQVELTIQSQNQIEAYFGDQPPVTIQGAGTVTVNIPPYSPDNPELTRILLRIFEAANDGGAIFSAQLIDGESDQAFDGEVDDLIVLTGPRGGI